MEQFAEYSHAIAALAFIVLIQLALSPAAGLSRNNSGKSAGAMPDPDYSDVKFRICRAYQNSAEMSGAFAGAILAAVLAGAPPLWINLFASLAVISRLVMVYVHIKGIGAGQEPGPRTFAYVFGWAMCLLIALFALIAAF